MDSFLKNYKADDLNNADVLSNAWNYMYLSVSVFIADMDDESPLFVLLDTSTSIIISFCYTSMFCLI